MQREKLKLDKYMKENTLTRVLWGERGPFRVPTVRVLETLVQEPRTIVIVERLLLRKIHYPGIAVVFKGAAIEMTDHSKQKSRTHPQKRAHWRWKVKQVGAAPMHPRGEDTPSHLPAARL
jgi:hypothetical protein